MFEFHAIPVTDGRNPAERFILYRPRAGLAFVGNRSMTDLVVRLSRDDRPTPDPADPAMDFLDHIGFLRPDLPLPQPEEHGSAPSSAVLLLTNQCHLRCTYCYAAAGEAPPAVLALDHARTAIDYVAAAAEGNPAAGGFQLSFHGGGEPTRAWRVLQECVRHARATNVPARITVTSNGIWSARQLGWLSTHVDGFTVSVDGNPATHDRQRPFPGGRASHPVVLRNMRALDSRRVAYAVRMTATRPWTGLAEDVKYLCENTASRRLNVEPAFNLGRGGHPSPDPAAASLFAGAFLRAADVATAAGRELVYSGARLGAVAVSHCSAPYRALIVAPGGNLVTCYEITAPDHPFAPISTIGVIANDRVVIDDQARRRLVGLLADRRRLCSGCWCFRTCAGDCYVRGFEPDEQGHRSFGARCEMNRAITKGLLLRRVAAAGGVWRAPTGPGR